MASTNNKDHLPNGEFTQKEPNTVRIRSLKSPEIPVRMQRRLVVKVRPKDSLLTVKDSLFKEKDSLFREKESPFKEKDSPFKEKDSSFKEKDSILKGKDSILKEKDSILKGKDSILKEKDSILKRKDSPLKEKDSTSKGKDSLSKGETGVGHKRIVKCLWREQPKIPVRLKRHSKEETSIKVAQKDIAEIPVLSKCDLPIEPLAKRVSSENCSITLQRKLSKISVRLQRNLLIKPKNSVLKNSRFHLGHRKSIILWRKQPKTSVHMEDELPIKDSLPGEEARVVVQKPIRGAFPRKELKIPVSIQRNLMNSQNEDSRTKDEVQVEVGHKPIREAFPRKEIKTRVQRDLPMNSQDVSRTKDKVQVEVGCQPIRGSFSHKELKIPVPIQRNLPMNSQDEDNRTKDEVQVKVDNKPIVGTLRRKELRIPVDHQPIGGTLQSEKSKIPARVHHNLPRNSIEKLPFPKDEVQVKVDHKPISGTFPRRKPLVRDSTPKDAAQVNDAFKHIGILRREPLKIPARVQHQLPKKLPPIDSLVKEEAIKPGRKRIGILRLEQPRFPLKKQTPNSRENNPLVMSIHQKKPNPPKDNSSMKSQPPEQLPAKDSILKKEQIKANCRLIGVLRHEQPRFPTPVNKKNRCEYSPLLKALHRGNPNPSKGKSSVSAKAKLERRLRFKETPKMDDPSPRVKTKEAVESSRQKSKPSKAKSSGPASPQINSPLDKPLPMVKNAVQAVESSRQKKSKPSKVKSSGPASPQINSPLDKPLPMVKNAVQAVESSRQKKSKPSKVKSPGPASPQINSPLDKPLPMVKNAVQPRQESGHAVQEPRPLDPKLFELMAIYMVGPPKLPTNFSTAAFCHLTQRMRDNNEFSKLKALVGLINQEPSSHLESLIQFFYMAEYLELKFYVRKMHFPDSYSTPEMRYIVDCYVFDDCKEYIASIGLLQSQLHALARLFPKVRQNFRFIDNAFELTPVNGRLIKWLKAALDTVKGQPVYLGLGELTLKSTRRLAAIYNLPKD